MNHEQKWLEQMRTLLYHNVPRFIEHIGKRGGVSKHEWLWLRCNSENPTFPIGLMARADEYLLYPKDEETFNQGLFILVKMLAIMAFVPGGVRFGGLHFDFDVVNFVEDD